MASINISEEDFQTVAFAALSAKDDGDMPLATKLDKIARKINAALTQARVSPMMHAAAMGTKPVRWQDMPSVLEDQDVPSILEDY